MICGSTGRRLGKARDDQAIRRLWSGFTGSPAAFAEPSCRRRRSPVAGEAAAVPALDELAGDRDPARQQDLAGLRRRKQLGAGVPPGALDLVPVHAQYLAVVGTGEETQHETA